MKKQLFLMNKNVSNESLPFEYPQMRMSAIGYVKLGEFWNKLKLTGHYWRLYSHDAPGTGVTMPDGSDIELLPGYVYLLPPNCALTTWRADGAGPSQLYIHFELSLFSGNPESPFNRLPVTPWLTDKLDRVKQKISTGKNETNVVLPALAAVAEVMTNLPSKALSRGNYDRRISMVCDFLRKHPETETGIADLASMAKMNQSAFLRLFREVTGSTPYKYLLHTRYAQASRLLEDSSLSIDEICELVGVKDRFHFSRMFKTMFGVPPACYRRKHPARGG